MTTLRGMKNAVFAIPWATRSIVHEILAGKFNLLDFILLMPESWRLVATITGLMKAKEKRAFLAGKPWHSRELSCTDFASAWQLFPLWEREVRWEMDKVRGGLFVDVGANIGVYTRRVALHGNNVIAFEASISTYRHLQETIRMNRIEKRVEAYRLACWKDDSILRVGGNSHSGMRRITDEGEESVRSVRLDDILKGKTPHLVKIDTEGSEPEVLEGMPETIKKGTKIVFEAWTKEKLAACMKHLSGYSVTKIDPINYVAVPSLKTSRPDSRQPSRR